jgi:ribosomal protein L19
MLSPTVIEDRNKEIGKTIMVSRAVKNEDVVNIFKFFLSNQITSLEIA